MKKIVSYGLLFLFQINFTSYTPRIITRTCHFHHTDEDYRKNLGNHYLQDAIHSNKEEHLYKPIQPTPQTQTKAVIPKRTVSIPSKFNQPKLDGLLMIQSLLPSIYHKPSISSAEILPNA